MLGSRWPPFCIMFTNEDDEAPILDSIDRRLIDQLVRDMRI